MGSGPTQHPVLTARPQVDLCRTRPCAAGCAPGTGHAGKVGSRMGRNLPCAWSCCWPRACISSPRPQPFSLYFYKYIERNIYDAKCNRDETPHWPGGPCVSISPETVTYLVLLGVLVVQDRVLGCLHFFLIIVTIIIIIIVLLFPHFLLGADGEPHPAAPGLRGAACPPRQQPDCAKCLMVFAAWWPWLGEQFKPSKLLGMLQPLSLLQLRLWAPGCSHPLPKRDARG